MSNLNLKDQIIVNADVMSAFGHTVSKIVEARKHASEVMTINEVFELLQYSQDNIHSSAEARAFFVEGGLEKYLDEKVLNKGETKTEAPAETKPIPVETRPTPKVDFLQPPLFVQVPNEGMLLSVRVSGFGIDALFTATEVQILPDFVYLAQCNCTVKILPKGVNLTITEVPEVL